MRKIVLGLLLILAACRSLPTETVNDIGTANRQGVAITSIWSHKIVPEANNAGSTLDVNALAIEWADHFHKLVVARDSVQSYLDGATGDKDVSLGYRTATELLLDFDANINMVFNNWNQWLDPAADKTKFILDINKMVADYKMLNAKFNEWANQFGVK
jgi:hypothetical protein